MTPDAAAPVIFIGGAEENPGALASRVGLKAESLARLHRAGLRVPPALAIARRNGAQEAFAGSLRAELAAGVRRLERETSLVFGSADPLLLAVRSSPPVSMPGILDTVLNVGLTEEGVGGVIRRTGNPWLAWDAYRRMIRSFARTVYHLPETPFEALADDVFRRADARSVQELDALSLRDLARRSRELLDSLASSPLPQEPQAQLLVAVGAVFSSWHSEKARRYREESGVDEGAGTGVVIQAMAFGNAGAASGSGVGFTRDPATGENALYVDFAFNAQGEDIVSGRSPVTEIAVLPVVLPAVWARLIHAKTLLEREFGDMQEFAFTVEEGEIYFLQSRAGRRTPRAAFRIASDLLDASLIDTAAAAERTSSLDTDRLVHRTLSPGPENVVVGLAMPAGEGVAIGRLVFDAERAQRLALEGPVVLARNDLNTDDLAGLVAAAGIVTTLGNRTSHGAVLARRLGKPCLVGCADLRVDATARGCMMGSRWMREGEVVTLDCDSGLIYLGAVPVSAAPAAESLKTLAAWRQASSASMPLLPLRPTSP